MTLQRRATLYLLVVMLGQLLLLGAMFCLLLISDNLAAEAKKSRDLIFKGTLLAGHMFDGSKTLGLYVLSHTKATEALHLNAVARYKESMDRFQTLATGMPQYQEPMTLLREDTDELIEIMALVKKIVDDTPMHLMAKKDSHRLQALATVAIPTLISRSRKHMKTIIDSQDKATNEARAQKMRNMLELVIAAGALLNVFGCFALITAFSNRITNRLDVLRCNALLLSSGEPLKPLVQGSDEISKLDKFFHNTAAVLNAATTRDQIILSSIPIGIIILAPDTSIQFANPTFENMTRFSKDELKDKFLRFFFPDATNISTLAGLAPLLETVTHSSLTTRDGPALEAEFSFASYTEDDNSFIVCSILDVSARHEIERLKREFVNIVSQDLRTPLTSVQSSLEKVKAGDYGLLNQKGIITVERSQRECNRLIRLVADLLTITKIESGKLSLELAATSIQSVMERSAASVRPFADHRQLHLEVDAPHGDLEADEDRLVQVFINLLSNAIKYSPARSTIKFRGEFDHDNLRIEVIDHGCGIPAEARERIFERFGQASSNDAITGTGLGLTIAKMIVEGHKGKIGVDSEEGNGSVFWILLPLHRA